MKKGKTEPSLLVSGILVLLFLFTLVRAVRTRSVDSLVTLALTFAACWASIIEFSGEKKKSRKNELDLYADFILHEKQVGFEYIRYILADQMENMGQRYRTDSLAAYWSNLCNYALKYRNEIDLLLFAGKWNSTELRDYCKVLLRSYRVWTAQLQARMRYAEQLQHDLESSDSATLTSESWYTDFHNSDAVFTKELSTLLKEVENKRSAGMR